MTNHIEEARKLEPEWHYEIQYGPEGEANYAWLYRGNEMVATMKTHHAISVCAALAAAEERGRMEERERCASKTPSTHFLVTLQEIADEIRALKLHPTTSEEYDAGYIGGRNDAFGIVQEVVDNLPPDPATEAGLSIEEQKAQGKRCGCIGSDDYCPCQNTPDVETRKIRAARAYMEGK